MIITKNELLASLDAPDAFHLALVQVENGVARQPIYVQEFFKRELGFAETAVIFSIDSLVVLAREHLVQLGLKMKAAGTGAYSPIRVIRGNTRVKPFR